MKYTECLTPRSLVFIRNLIIIKILKYLQHTYFSLCEVKTTGNAQQFGQRHYMYCQLHLKIWSI